MQPTKSRQRNDLVSAPRSRGRNATVGCVLPQSEMSAIFVVIADVVFQQSFQVPLVQNDDVIKQISTHTPNPALGETILPRTAECRADGFSSVLLDGRNNVSGKFRVAVKYRTLRGGNCFTRTSYEHTIPLSNLFADGDGRASFQKWSSFRTAKRERCGSTTGEFCRWKDWSSAGSKVAAGERDSRHFHPMTFWRCTAASA